MKYKDRVWRESNLALLVLLMTSQLCWQIVKRSQELSLVWPWVRSRCLGHLSSHLSSQQPSCIFLLNMSHVNSQNFKEGLKNSASRLVWLISPIFLQRTRIIMGPWGCGCMRGTINQVRIQKLHQEKFLSRDPPPSPCIIQVIKLFRCRNLHLRLLLSKARFCFKVKLSNDQRLNRKRRTKPKSKFKSKCRSNQTMWNSWFIGLAGKTCPKTMQCNAASLFPIAKIHI